MTPITPSYSLYPYQQIEGVIYKITSPTNRIYIGQSVNFKLRLSCYKRHFCPKQKRLLASLVKYGFDKHCIEIIDSCKAELLNNRERYWQDYYDATSSFNLNIRLTKSSDKSGVMSDETKNKISIANSGNNNGMFGKRVSPESRKAQNEKKSGELNYLSKWILNTNTGIFYPCLKEAAESIGMIKGTLWSKMKFRKHTTPFIYT